MRHDIVCAQTSYTGNAAPIYVDWDVIPEDVDEFFIPFCEFYAAGVSVMPFDEISIHIKSPSQFIDVFLKKDHHERIAFVIFGGTQKDSVVGPIATGYISKPIKVGERVIYSFFSGSEEEKAATPSIMNVILASLQIFSCNEVEREKVSISETLNKARAKSGKPALRDYILIKLSEESKAKLAQTENGVVTFRKPHWRRGHLRHIGDGRIVPVCACIVNFNGMIPDKKTYIVKA